MCLEYLGNIVTLRRRTKDEVIRRDVAEVKVEIEQQMEALRRQLDLERYRVEAQMIACEETLTLKVTETTAKVVSLEASVAQLLSLALCSCCFCK